MNAMTSVVSCVPIPKWGVDAVWPEAAPMINLAVMKTAKDKFTIEAIRDGIEDGTYLLWVILVDGKMVASFTTRVMKYPLCRALCVDWLGGTGMKVWLGVLIDALKVHARHNGCVHMEACGRRAWKKWLERYGWREDYASFKMET